MELVLSTVLWLNVDLHAQVASFQQVISSNDDSEAPWSLDPAAPSDELIINCLEDGGVHVIGPRGLVLQVNGTSGCIREYKVGDLPHIHGKLSVIPDDQNQLS